MRTLLLIVVLGIAACGGGSKTTTPPTNSGETKPEETAKAVTCGAGEMQHEGVCLKECAEDKDCGEGEQCEQLHAMNDDGTIGPVAGNGCTK